jgi:leucyl/phenylalanyl-tRNA--protein transferase
MGESVQTFDPASPLSPELVLLGYRRGYFPMAESRHGRVCWYTSDPRAVIPLDRFRIPRSLRQVLKKHPFSIAFDTAFPDVIRACAGRAETWISDEVIEVYTMLHRRGDAHSVEAWRGRTLAGGLYGVAIGGAFFGESMFSRESNASKVALVGLVHHLRARGFRLLDSQFMNEHMRQFGTVEIPQAWYLRLLAEAIGLNTTFLPDAVGDPTM